MLGSLILSALIIFACQPCVHCLYFMSVFNNIEIRKKTVNPFSLKTKKYIYHIDQEKFIYKGKLQGRLKNREIIYQYIISMNDTLDNALNWCKNKRNNISRIVVINNKFFNLNIEQKLSWILPTESDLQNFKYKTSQKEAHIHNYVDNNFKISSELQHGNWVNRVLKGTINDSFFTSARNAGLTNSEIFAVIKAMQWQMDFRKLKKGNQFSILTSREMLDGRCAKSQLVGVRLHSSGKDYYAIRAADGNFYDHNGISLAQSFLRFPTAKQFRVSSNFNLHRLNPVTGHIAPHRGVDFATPQGTPVLAVGDGKVIVAKRSGTAGYYITVCHNRIYMTRYMHLYKLLVKPGQKVKCGDHIALSGNTGRSTGPHLHYEVWINQKAVNPLTAKLPFKKILTGKDRHNYLIQIKEIMLQLRLD